MLLIALATTALAWTPNAGERELLAALSSRDAPATCLVLELSVDDPIESLQNVVEHVSFPPWAPMRAAGCLLENHAEEAESTFHIWLSAENTAGLAKLVMLRLKTLPDPLALRLAEKALLGPHAERSRVKLQRDSRPSIRALAQ